MELSIDIECSFGPNRPIDKGFYLTCVGIVNQDGKETVIWFDHSEVNQVGWQTNLSVLRHLIEKADTIIAHNLKYDMTVLRNYNISFEKQKLWCTMVTEYLLSGHDKRRTFSLDAVAKHYDLGMKFDKVKALWSSGIETYDIPKDVLSEYVLQDCHLAMEIYKKQKEHPEMPLLSKVHALQMEFQLSLSDMELYGFKFNADKAHELVNEMDNTMAMMEDEIKEIAGEQDINIGSWQQRSAILFGGVIKKTRYEWVIVTLKSKPESRYYEKAITYDYEHPGLGFTPPNKIPKEYCSSDKATISKLTAKTPAQKRIKSLLLEYSVVKKAKETLHGKDNKGLINKIGVDGNIHPHFNMTVTATGRLSGSDPNPQNMPRGSTSPLKKCVEPIYDEILQLDLSQIEWRGAAELSDDEVMKYEINDGVDQHSAACVDIMRLKLTKDNRNYAKIFNFRMIFGGSGYGFYMDGKMPNFTKRRWDEIVKEFNEKYWGLIAWQDKNVDHISKHGELRIKTGRKFVFQRDENFAFPERAIKNYPVQGLAGGDILPLVSVIVRRGMKKANMKSRMILTVHDSLVFDIKTEEKERLIKLLSYVLKYLVNYIKGYYDIDWSTNLAGELECGLNYGELKPIELAKIENYSFN